MSKATYDAIVVGLGGMGSATLLALARRGLRVLGVERFAIGHDRGSSHGETRIIRKAYFEHPDYVPLVTLAEKGWGEFEAQSGRRLWQRCGLLLGGPRDGRIISGARRAATVHTLAFEDVSPQDVAARFPGFSFGDDLTFLFEPQAGLLYVDDCVRACIDQAIALGATVREGVTAQNWRSDGGSVAVEADKGTFKAGSLALCGGPWSDTLLGELAVPLEVQRRVLLWFASTGGAYALSAGSPVFGVEIGEHFFYGFPSLDGDCVKVSEHLRSDPAASADEVRREIASEDTAHIRAFVRSHLPCLTDRVVKQSVCLYTMTPDEQFVVDRHPEYPNVAIAAGFSGHGFKFAPVIGSVLADLLIDGATDAPIASMGLARFHQVP